MLVGVLIAIGVLGLVLVVRGLAGSIKGDEPRCRKCRFDLSGLEPGLCPECGASLVPKAIIYGRRQRRWVMVLVGLPALSPCLAQIGLFAVSSAFGVQPVTLSPHWLLVAQLRHADNWTTAPAFVELTRRLDAGKMSQHRMDTFASVLCDLHERDAPYASFEVVIVPTLQTLMLGHASATARSEIIDRMLDRRDDLNSAWPLTYEDVLLDAHAMGRLSSLQDSRLRTPVLRPRVVLGGASVYVPGQRVPVFLDDGVRVPLDVEVYVAFSMQGLSAMLSPERRRELSDAAGYLPVALNLGTILVPDEPGLHRRDASVGYWWIGEDDVPWISKRGVRLLQNPIDLTTVEDVDFARHTPVEFEVDANGYELPDDIERWIRSFTPTDIEVSVSAFGGWMLADASGQLIVPQLSEQVELHIEILARQSGLERGLTRVTFWRCANGSERSLSIGWDRRFNSEATSNAPLETIDLGGPTDGLRFGPATIVMRVTKLSLPEHEFSAEPGIELVFPDRQIRPAR
jgi:hypothetical protein